MRLSRNLARLSRLRRHVGTRPAPARSTRLVDLGAFSPNPGALIGRVYVPAGLPAGAPLVVVLHGCTQDAAVYDQGSGWSRLADRLGFALLYPEQTRANNFNLCFNWYQPADVRRGSGEARSIAAMIDRLVAVHGLDRDRVFITGLSAGGAMASAMLAAYPERFAAGAIVAGLAAGAADTLAEALSEMSSPEPVGGTALGDAVRSASPHPGPWPRISVWHGRADRLVVPANGAAIVSQWLDVHSLPARPSRTERVAGHARRAWESQDGEVIVEEYVIAGMGHGTPLDPGMQPGRSGEAGAHMIDVGLSSTDRIAAFFGLGEAAVGSETQPREREAAAQPAAPREDAESTPPTMPARPASNDVQAVIEGALRRAGLMR
jgi:poly(hydroxyalkanoate) depolymerase family esterase